MIRDYKIKKKLGIGSYGTVYLVQKSNFEYVIKQISLFSLSPKQKLEVKQESKLLSKINSKYVVKYYESFEEKDNLNIVMEYCNYGDLNEFLEKHKNSGHLLLENLIWKIFIKISLGLGYIHSENILHRDLKSLNIFLTNELDIKIGDLGVAKQLQNTCFANTFIGTPYYLSPEMCEEKPYNEKSDVWALGCILYELCTFKHPFNANSQGALILKIIKGKFEMIPNMYSEDMKKLVSDLLKRDFNVRPTVFEVLRRKEIVEKSKEFGLYSDIMELENKINSNNNINNNKNLNINKVELNFNNLNNNNNINQTNHSNHKIKINNIRISNNSRPQSAAINRNNLIGNNNNNVNNGFKINHINLNFNNLNNKNNNLLKDNFFSNNNWPIHNNNKKLLSRNIKITDNKRIIRHNNNNNNIINIMNKNSAVKIIENNNNIEKEPKKNFIKIKIDNFEESLERNKNSQEEKKRLFNSGFNALNKNYKLQNNINNNNKSNSNEKINKKNNNNKINSKFETKITKIEKKTKENNNNNINFNNINNNNKNNNKTRPSTAPEKNQIKKPELKEEEFQIIQNNQKSSTIITDTDSSCEEENNNNLNDSNKNTFQNSNSAKFNHKKVDNNDFSSSLEEEDNYYKYNLTDEKRDEESFSEDEEEIVKEVVKDEKEKKEKIKEKEKLEKEIKEYEKKINKIKNDIKNYLGESEFNFFMNLYKQIEKNNEDGEIDKIFLIIEDFINKKIEENKFNLNLDLKELYSLLISYDFQISSLKKNIIENFQ